MRIPDRIEIKNDVMGGKPCIAGTRIPVYLILQMMGAGETEAAILMPTRNFPTPIYRHARSMLLKSQPKNHSSRFEPHLEESESHGRKPNERWQR